MSATAAAATAYAVTTEVTSDTQEQRLQFTAVTGSAFLGLILANASMKYILENLQTRIQSAWAKTGINIATQTALAFTLIELVKLAVPPQEDLQIFSLDAESLIPLLLTVLPTKAAVEALVDRYSNKEWATKLAGILAECAMIVGGSWSIKEIAEFLGASTLDQMPLAGYAFSAAAATNGLVHMLVSAGSNWAYSFFDQATDEAENAPLMGRNAGIRRNPDARVSQISAPMQNPGLGKFSQRPPNGTIPRDEYSYFSNQGDSTAIMMSQDQRRGHRRSDSVNPGSDSGSERGDVDEELVV